MSSVGVRCHMSSITCQVSGKYRVQYHILTRIAGYHVLKITVASVRHVKIFTYQYHAINTRAVIIKPIQSTRISYITSIMRHHVLKAR